MNSLLRPRSLSLASCLVMACYLPLASAETTMVEIQSGDTLGKIIAQQYPGYKNRSAIMQAILERNPESFRGQNINNLMIGKTLQLPAPADIPALEPPIPPTAGADQATLERLQATEKERNTLNTRVQALETDKSQLEQAKTQLGEQLQAVTADKTKLEQERDSLNTRLQTLEADKNQLVAKVDELSKALQAQATTNTAVTPAQAPTTASGTPDTAEGDQPDPEILMQQLDAIESANEELLTAKATLEKERDELSARLQTLETDKQQLESQLAKLNTQPQLAAAPSTTEPLAEDQPDPEILMQQLDDIESANQSLLDEKSKLETSNAQLLTEKGQLQTELTTTQKQAQAQQDAANNLGSEISALKIQVEQLQNKQTETEKNLQVARAAHANAELTKANIEKNRPVLWPWLLGLLLLPLAWYWGRRSQQTAVIGLPKTVNQPTPTVIPTPAQQLEVGQTDGTSPDPLGILDDVSDTADKPADTDTAITPAETSPAYSTHAANDDNLDAAIKLDIVRAYLDLRDPQAAKPLLKEVLREGGRQQRQEAREILSFLS